MVDGEGQGKLSDPLVDLTPQELTAFLHVDAHMMPRSKKDLQSWAKSYFGWQLAGVQICPDHQAPLDILWELFQEEVLDVVILASRTGGKCCVGDDRIMTAAGAWMKVKEIVERRRIASWRDGKMVSAWAGPAEFNSVKPCIRFRLYSGREHTVTYEHPLLLRDGWREAKDIQVGDELAIVQDRCYLSNTKSSVRTLKSLRKIRCKIPGKRPDIVGLAALMVGDGHCRMPIGFTNADPGVLDAAKAVCASFGWGMVMNRWAKKPEQNWIIVQGDSRLRMADALKALGLYGCLSADKRVPDFVMRGSRDDVRRFLGLYFACDGHVSEERWRRRVEFYSVSRELLHDVQLLLIGLGISGRLCRKNGRYNGARHVSWRLVVNGKEAVRFARALRDFVPGRKGTLLKGIEKKYRAEACPRQGPFGWDKVVEKVEVGEQETWNLPVEGTHVYLANGFVSHNTVGLALLNVLDALFKSRVEVASMGAVLQQATKGYRYFADMLVNHELFAADVKDTSMRETQLTNGSIVQVLTGTITGVNSPHPHKARADEVELIEWEVLQQFFSMARSERGIQGQNVLSSTRKGLWGSMQRLLDKMENEPQFPFVLRTWCVKEVLEKCTEPCWKCREIVRAEDERTFWDVCQGEARNSDGFYSVRDLHRKFLILDANVFDAEWECKKPSKQGLIYRELKDEQVGVHPFDPTKETFIGVDDGFVDPFVFLVLQKDGYGNIWAVRELFGSGKEHSTWIDEIKSLFYELGLNMKKTVIYVDVRATALIAELRKAGFQVRARSYGVVDSIRHVKKWVKGVHHPKLFIDGEFCPNLKREMGIYRYKPGSEQPMDKDNHACDALRYGICGKFPMRSSESGGGVPASAGDGGRLARETDPYNLEPEFTTRRKVDGW